MAKKKNITENDLMSFYMDYVLEHNEQPKTVYAFAKHNNFDEALFYNFYGTFEALEKSVFKTFFENTLITLHKSEEYASYESRDKLLSFYFTFFENLTANRSYVLQALKVDGNKLKSITKLSELKKAFTDYIDSLDIEMVDMKEARLVKFQQKTLKESAWLQLIVTLKFWMDDTSKNFEKTDVFIEKAVNTSFDLIDTQPIKSIIDLGKFLYKEKMKL
ncbi:TetR/AcrR family transcriptional regulator [Aureibaculum sp. A20]|uniref:TetR/AcrR family transcriptional regulator n=1 Tax=Aureibaculum flavum TaxID=2795986 RepID=A0ABS0WMY3_9FLAO|nr:TetR family transcriptional regulator C-terminal domain-containing protein [Aureibaculum flavum]MBJ2173326.1 TetR/AcrR family transcriptional regulator [Aureibaculum flavum]